VDVGSIALGVATGQVGRTTGGLLGVAAISTIGLGILGLRGL
jgi:hypothetical protein